MKMRDGTNFFINWMQLFHDFPQLAFHCTVEYESRFHHYSGGHFEVCWMAFVDVGKLLEI